VPKALSQQSPNFFERSPNLNLLNASRPMPQATYDIISVWMIFSSKLLSSFSLSAIYSFLKYLRYRQTKTSSGNGENIQPRFRSPRRDPFLTLCDPYFRNHCSKQTSNRERFVACFASKLQRQNWALSFQSHWKSVLSCALAFWSFKHTFT